MFVERDGQPPQEVRVDPAHIDRQVRDLRAQGYTVTVLDEDERIRMGLIAQQLRDHTP
jgi:hypothetical protein